MKYILSLIIVFLCISCGNKKELLLPEIDKAEINEITDVSAAYLFYDETQPDSVELNRKNLISTTNWLVNVDKRLTLKQAIPHIKFLQDKKKSSSHKNEKAKNYFTCHDLSENNLGFIEFTSIEYYQNLDTLFNRDHTKSKNLSWEILIHAKTKDSISIDFPSNESGNMTSYIYSRQKNLQTNLKNIISDSISDFIKNRKVIIYLGCVENLKFQDYISLKFKLNQFDIKNTEISNKEFIYN